MPRPGNPSDKHGGKDGHSFQGPFLDGSKATGMEVAYVDLRVGPLSRIYQPQPSTSTINEVLAGNAPEFALNQALASGAYVPSAQVQAVDQAYKAWQSQPKAR